jgi:hypothetical protein
MNVKPCYDDMVKKEDPSNSKVMLNFNRSIEISEEEYKSLPAKNNWNSNVKYSLFSINKDLVDSLIHLCHLVMLTAFKLKVSGEDALVRSQLATKLELESSTTYWRKHMFLSCRCH